MSSTVSMPTLRRDLENPRRKPKSGSTMKQRDAGFAGPGAAPAASSIEWSMGQCSIPRTIHLLELKALLIALMRPVVPRRLASLLRIASLHEGSAGEVRPVLLSKDRQ